MSIQILDPRADCITPARQYVLSAEIGDHTTLGLVNNKIVDCDRFMAHIGNNILSRFPNIKINYYDTGKITYADQSLIDRIASECDAAVCAIGHCGSCTAGTVKDGIALVEKGCPAVSLVTQVFWNQAELLAKSLGWPNAPRVELPYPVWGTSDSDMQEICTSVVDEILKQLENDQH